MDFPGIERSRYMFVAAIRFGSSRSGYAFSSVDDLCKGSPSNLNVNVWDKGRASFQFNKMPTSLLLNPDQSFHSFGFDAENNYTDLVEDDQYRQYYYFNRFTKNLYRPTITITEATGKKVLAKTVFSECITFFKKKIFLCAKEAYADVMEKDIYYVLTIPATWDTHAEQFILECADEAGITCDQLAISLKQEVMAVYCKHLIDPLQDSLLRTNQISEPVANCMVVDVGGKHTEISIYERLEDDSLKLNGPSITGQWGGKDIDDKFRAFVEDILPGMVLEELKQNSLEDYIELSRQFEIKKCEMTSYKTSKVSIALPLALIELVKKSTEGMDINNWLSLSPYPEVEFRRYQHLQMPFGTLEMLFKPTIDGILNMIRDNILITAKCANVENILLVGGFAKCDLLQKAVITKFPQQRIIVPIDPSLAILEGAVLFGYTKILGAVVSQNANDLKDNVIKEDKENEEKGEHDKDVVTNEDEVGNIISNIVDDKEETSKNEDDNNVELELEKQDEENKEEEKEENEDEISDDEEEKEDNNDESGNNTDQKDSVLTFSQQIQVAEKTIHIKPEEVIKVQQTVQKKYKYFEQGPVAVTPEILEKGLNVNDKSELCFVEVEKETLELDNKEINEMVFASKAGNWNAVWKTLDRKPYLVNCIPEQRAWSALHQAIYLANLQAVTKLVEEYGADITVRTKADRAHAADPGTDALSLAKQLGRQEIVGYLKTHTIANKTAMKGQDISYFALHKNGSIYPFHRYPLFQVTLASYKSVFVASNSYHLDKSQHIEHVIKDVVSYSDATWDDAKVKIRSTLYGIDRGHSEYLLSATNKDDFFGKLIKLYSEESVYNYLTPAFIRQPTSPYKPMAADLAVGPFALMLTTVLLKWDKLEMYGGTTFRGVSINVIDKYQVGETFLFLHFVSSSKLEKEANRFVAGGGTMFIFDNSTITQWRPRVIENYSRYPYEKECLYPLGAEFKVSSIDKNSRKVHLQLLDPSK